jgi:hypothetical protein
MKFISGTSSVPWRASAGIVFYTSHFLWIGRNEIFLNDGSRQIKGPSASVDTDDAFHTYRIEVEGVNADDAVKVFYDGGLTLTGALFVADEDEHPLIGWGDVDYFSTSGISEWQSFRHNASAVPRMEIYPAAEICWPSETNRTYQVQWALSLGATSWTNLGESVPGTGGEICIFDSTRGSARRFYRIQLPIESAR